MKWKTSFSYHNALVMMKRNPIGTWQHTEDLYSQLALGGLNDYYNTTVYWMNIILFGIY